jgi:hypothetical protein
MAKVEVPFALEAAATLDEAGQTGLGEPFANSRPEDSALRCSPPRRRSLEGRTCLRGGWLPATRLRRHRQTSPKTSRRRWFASRPWGRPQPAAARREDGTCSTGRPSSAGVSPERVTAPGLERGFAANGT